MRCLSSVEAMREPDRGISECTESHVFYLIRCWPMSGILIGYKGKETINSTHYETREISVFNINLATL